MRIIFLNCWYGKTGKVFDEFIKKEADATDIFCLQEVQPELFSKLQSLLPDHKGMHMTENELIVVGYLYGQAIFAKKGIELTPAQKINLYRNLTNDAGFGQYSSLTLGNKTLHIANIHGKALPGHKFDTEARIRQSNQIIDFFKDKKGPKIIGGDFNLMPDTKSIGMIEKTGLTNLIKKFKIKNTRTWLGWEAHKHNPGFVKQHFADYCFVSPEIKVKKFEVPNVEISDHLPLILEFEI